jgi:hypothetical protein
MELRRVWPAITLIGSLSAHEPVATSGSVVSKLALLVLNIALINFWNRANGATRQLAGCGPR